MKNWLNRLAVRVAQASGGIPISEGQRGTELYDWMTTGSKAAGVAVNEKTAMSVAAVYACVDLIGGAVSSIPLHFYRQTESGRERYKSPLWYMFNERAFTNWSSSAMFKFALSSKLLQGDGFIQIHRKPVIIRGKLEQSGEIIGFEPIHPNRTDINKVGGRLKYTFWKEDENEGGFYPITVDQDDVLHFTGPGFDGKRSMSQLKHVLRNPAGVAIAAEEYSARFFENGAKPDFALEVPGEVSPEQQEMMRNTWADRHQGVYKSHRPALLTGGAKVHELSINAEDAQLLSTRSFQVEEIARVFGVPPHMIGHTEKSTSWGTGIEQMSIGFVKFSLLPHLVGMQQEINYKLFRTARNFCEFDPIGLERGDTKTRNESYRIALGRAGEPGWMTVNEVRRAENLPPVEGGELLFNAEQSAQEAMP